MSGDQRFSLPAGTRFDPGGVGKGLAGDLVAAHLLELGARSVQVELGGDVRVAGAPWVRRPSGGWRLQHLDGSAQCAQLVARKVAEWPQAASTAAPGAEAGERCTT